MAKLFIDKRQVEVADGATILEAAEKLGIAIPTMCFLKGYKASTSCMVCMVQVEGRDDLLPACGAMAEEGMKVVTCGEKIEEARRAALELLLSDHLGDCMGPCHVVCPAKMNIPLMIRQIAVGKLEDAIKTVKKDIALPAILGRICPAPCEKACRRSYFDEAVSICLLKRYVADTDLASDKPFTPECAKSSGKKIAIVGAGPAGLSAAYYLLQDGHDCTIFEKEEKPGGRLRYSDEKDELDGGVIDAEVSVIKRIGGEFQFGKTVGKDNLLKDFDAALFVPGRIDEQEALKLGLEWTGKGVKFARGTFSTKTPGVFAAGDAGGKRPVVRAVADGKEAAASINQFLSDKEITGVGQPFNTRIGKIESEAKQDYSAIVNSIERQENTSECGFTGKQAEAETSRCMHCDCRGGNDCKLRVYAEEYGAKASKYKGLTRKFEQYGQHEKIIFEPGKCIDCGLCVQITAEAKDIGVTFIGRGFNVRVAVPFNRSIADALKKTAEKCARACPTGALAFKDEA
jgi:NADPH-dependent glutamate synthase beta subunit-like oxidoreductase